MSYTLLRILSFAWKNIIRNLGLALTTILLLTLALLSVNVLVVVNTLAQTAVQSVEDRIDVSVIFRPEASPEIVEEVRATLERSNLVREVTLMQRDEVLVKFKERHAGDAEILASLETLNENPLGPTIVVRAKDPRAFDAILSAIDLPEYNAMIEEKTLDRHEEVLRKITNGTAGLRRVGYGLTLLFAAIAFFIIFNAVRVKIYTQREEIGIMKLVGASNWFVRAPFFAEGFFLCLVSLLLGAVTVFIAARLIDPAAARFFEVSGFSIVTALGTQAGLLLLFELLAVFFLYVLSSGLAMRRYLRV